MFGPIQEAMQSFTKGCERTAGKWWDGALRQPRTLESMGGWLNGVCTVKERSDQALEEHWARWRLPSATDVERLHERIGDLEQQLARVEDLLEAALESGKVVRNA
jgi:hypothetical protein